MRHLPLILCVGCASHALEVTHSVPEHRFDARVWVGEPHESFLLIADNAAVAEFAALAAETGHELRRAREDDFRQSWPTLRVSEVLEPDGSIRVDCDLSAADHVALVNLWVELMAVRESRRENLAPAPEQFVRTAVHSTRSARR